MWGCEGVWGCRRCEGGVGGVGGVKGVWMVLEEVRGRMGVRKRMVVGGKQATSKVACLVM